MRLLIVGMNPSATPERVKVRKNSTLDRLNKWMDFVGVQHYSFINVVEQRGKVSHKDVDYDFLKTVTSDYKYILALGNFASDALRKIHCSHFRLPHPSPLNRVLNDKITETLYLMAFKDYLGGYDAS